MTFFNKKTKDASSSYSCSGGSSCGVSVASSEQTSPTIRSEVGRLADAFIMYVDIRDRRYRARVWRDCFIGSEAVDALIYAGLADNRENAVLVGRHLQKELRLFAHVCDDHDFKDDFLFYRMKKTKMSFEELPIQHFSNLEQKAKVSAALQQLLRKSLLFLIDIDIVVFFVAVVLSNLRRAGPNLSSQKIPLCLCRQ